MKDKCSSCAYAKVKGVDETGKAADVRRKNGEQEIFVIIEGKKVKRDCMDCRNNLPRHSY